MKKSKTTLEKERLMKEVLGKRSYGDIDIKTFEEEIKRDFGITYEKPLKDNKLIFDEALKQLNEIIVGQDEALNKLCMAFRRPYVMKNDNYKSAMIVYGNEGVGKHLAIAQLAKILSKDDIVNSYDVYSLDMSTYTSSSQELLFLQDLFSAINGRGSIICFENFKGCHRNFLNMLSDLVVDGQIVLNKRYIMQKGQLIESQSGLVKSAIRSINAKDKYLIFIGEGSIGEFGELFGKSFIEKIQDEIYFRKLNDDEVKILIEAKLKQLIYQSKDKLDISISVDDSIEKWLLAHFDSTKQMESIMDLLKAFYLAISQYVLEFGKDSANLVVEDSIAKIKGINHELPLYEQDDEKEELVKLDQELDEIVGLKEVKDYIHSLKSHMLMQQRRKAQGMKTIDISKHMIFMGNPGTGKTTIARLISRYMRAIGILKQGQLIEVTRSDLVGKYVGHTAPMTMQVIKSAIGGVLFIDEAYSLYRGKDDSYGLECIDTLVKAMEDYRDELIVILAGYDKEMSEFLEANSGLRSRFPNIIHFDDYSAQELLDIAKSIASKQDYKIDELAYPRLLAYFNKIQANKDIPSGNGRLARNLVEKAILQQAKRLAYDNSNEIDLLIEEDFALEE